MNATRAILPLLLLGLAAGASHGQPAAPPPHSGPSPLLYVRLLGPAGSRFTVYQGEPNGVQLESPLAIALRPGYAYRMKLSELQNHPGVSLYPTLEVRGTLHLPPGQPAAQHPTPVVLGDLDVERVLAGAFITKVITLEHPERAAPAATEADQPLETDVRPHEDILAHARVLGRPMLIVRLGGRTVPAEDGTGFGIANTVLLPGCRTLGPPPVPPQLAWSCHALYDPILGPRFPEEECLHDGGDSGRAAGIDREGRLRGLDPADTVAEYSTNAGRRQLAISNRVCVCVPRFTVLKQIIIPSGYNAVHSPGGADATLAHSLVRVGTPSIVAIQREHLETARGRESATVVLARVGPAIVDQFLGTITAIGRREGQVVVGTLTPELPVPPEQPLLLCKTVDRHAAQIGDIVTFTLKYTNPGGQPISNIILSDSLTARLEYVPGSARADRAALFTTQANEAGSVILRWEIGGKLLPGQTGVVTFQARIR